MSEYAPKLHDSENTLLWKWCKQLEQNTGQTPASGTAVQGDREENQLRKILEIYVGE